MIESYPTVSVIIPTYNRASLIEKPIKSILAQTFQDFEIVVVDDCSTDNTEEVVKAFNDRRINYFRHQKNQGAGVSRNTGIANSASKYVAFLDSDDEWLPEKLEKQVTLFQNSNAEVGMVYTWLCNINDSGEVMSVSGSRHRGFIKDDLLYSNFVGTPSTVMLKRECLEKVGGFDPAMLTFVEDLDLWIRIATHYQVEVIPEVLVRYLDSGGRDRAKTNHKRVVESALAFSEKHHKSIDLDKNYKHIGTLSNREKAKYFFRGGRLMISHGVPISHSKAVATGRDSLLLAYFADPSNLRYLLDYVVVYLFGGDAYMKFVNSESNLRSWISKTILRKRKQLHPPQEQNSYGT